MWKRTAVATAGMTPPSSPATDPGRSRLEEQELLRTAAQAQLVPHGGRNVDSFAPWERPAAVSTGKGERPLVKNRSRLAVFDGNRLVGDELDLAQTDTLVDEPRRFGELHRLDLDEPGRAKFADNLLAG